MVMTARKSPGSIGSVACGVMHTPVPGAVLGLPHGIDVAALAEAWFPGAVWERAPVTAAQAQRRARPMAGARFRGVTQDVAAEPGVLRLLPGVVLVGPEPLEAPVGGGAPRSAARLLDGYTVAHDHAQPPAEVAHWLQAAARHAGGVVVAPDRSQIVTYDAALVVDLALWSAVALPLEALVQLVRPRLPGARVTTTGPAGAIGPAGPASSAVTPYELVARFEYDGDVRVRFGRAHPPRVLETMGWRDHGPFAYAVRWHPPEPAELDALQPTRSHLIARGRIAPVVARVVAALMPAVGGVVVDDGGFLVSPADLGARTRGSAG